MASQSPLLSHLLLFLVIVLFLFLSASTLRCVGSDLGSSDGSGAAAAAEMRPAMTEASASAAAPSIAAMVAARRRLGSFQICAPCTCCGGPKGLCLLSPCCYAINCNFPNKPFGFCSFTPNSCDCLACNL
ncbi:uncharacterized protein LOC109717838 [Ananas comosus]|uniref:Uncharacterized protein LOC109717838 n=1 Tax=Ananas comosus TaxID=4615 RepID=A0A6P5G264_ANACO|nr:uncharacterized protein LOC109717838 [Ananas comosus]